MTNEYVQEHKEDMCFLGYVETQGEVWTLVGMTEAEADAAIKEYSTTGNITLQLYWAQSSRVITPVAAAKLKSDTVYYAKPKEEGTCL